MSAFTHPTIYIYNLRWCFACRQVLFRIYYPVLWPGHVCVCVCVRYESSILLITKHFRWEYIFMEYRWQQPWQNKRQGVFMHFHLYCFYYNNYYYENDAMALSFSGRRQKLYYWYYNMPWAASCDIRFATERPPCIVVNFDTSNTWEALATENFSFYMI